jgi:hypothetical protein
VPELTQEQVSRAISSRLLVLAKGRAAGARFACPSGSRQPVADRVASWDQEHPRRQALPARLLHQQSVGALTGSEAFPPMAAALAIAWRQARRTDAPAPPLVPQRDSDDFQLGPTDSSRAVDVVPMYWMQRGRVTSLGLV